MLTWLLNLGFAAGGVTAAEPVGGYEIDSQEANFYEILEPRKAKRKIKIIRKVIRTKKAAQKAAPKEFDSSELQALQIEYNKLVALYTQLQQSKIKRESDQATKSIIEAQNQSDKLYAEFLERQEAEDEAAMIEIILKYV